MFVSKYIDKRTDELYPFDEHSTKGGLVLSKEIIEGMHGCVEAGMTSAQITSVLLLTSGLFRMKHCDPENLIGRIYRILSVIEHDSDLKGDVEDEFFLDPEEDVL